MGFDNQKGREVIFNLHKPYFLETSGTIEYPSLPQLFTPTLQITYRKTTQPAGMETPKG